MFEKVSPSHPDKIADRIAGALVDIAYKKQKEPKIAVEVLIGHGACMVIIETSVIILRQEVEDVVKRIAGEGYDIRYVLVPQDETLAKNQEKGLRCGDNGIFKGCVITDEQRHLTEIARLLYEKSGHKDGKYILSDDDLIICQSNMKTEDVRNLFPDAKINPLGDWTGGLLVDSGCENRKIGSDLGDAATGGGINGKDLSKADVAVNIYAHVMAQKEKKEVNLYCAIGDKEVNGIPYSEIVRVAKEYIDEIGGFEKLAEWGLIRP